MSFRTVLARPGRNYKPFISRIRRKNQSAAHLSHDFPLFCLFYRPETHSSSKTAISSPPYNPKTVLKLTVRKCVSEPSCSDGHLVRIMGRRSVFACFTAFFDADLVRKMGISGFASCKCLAGVASHTAKRRPLSAL